MLHKQYPDNEEKRLKAIDNYGFVDFQERLFLDVHSQGVNSKFNAVCEGAYPGQATCAYNIAKAFALAYQHLTQHVSANQADWKWSNLHSNEYANLPWSKTPLRFLFHREVPTFGNSNTPHVSKVSYRQSMDKMLFKSSHVAGYKQIIAHADTPHKGTNLYSIDTGLNGNILAGHYFDMNKDHLAGNLKKMIIGP